MCSFPELLNGILVTPGYSLVNTRAKQGVIGEKDYKELCARLKVFGLKPRVIPTFQATATGVGGDQIHENW